MLFPSVGVYMFKITKEIILFFFWLFL